MNEHIHKWMIFSDNSKVYAVCVNNPPRVIDNIKTQEDMIYKILEIESMEKERCRAVLSREEIENILNNKEE